MPHDKIAALALDAVEVDEDNSTSGSQGVMNGLERSLRKLEVMIGVADENEIDGVLGQLGAELVTQHRLDVLDLGVLACLLIVTKEGRGYILGVNLALVSDLGGELSGEQASASANVGDDLLGLGGDLSALPLELLEEVFEIGIFKGLVDSGLDALLLGRGWNQDQKVNAKDSSKS
jgi:hypothetical protein